MTHFCARRSTRPRSSKPIASHAGCAARALATSPLTSLGDSVGIVAIVSPVAGFSTGMPVPLCAAVGACSTLAIDPLPLGAFARSDSNPTGAARTTGQLASCVGVF